MQWDLCGHAMWASLYGMLSTLPTPFMPFSLKLSGRLCCRISHVFHWTDYIRVVLINLPPNPSFCSNLAVDPDLIRFSFALLSLLLSLCLSLCNNKPQKGDTCVLPIASHQEEYNIIVPLSFKLWWFKCHWAIRNVSYTSFI